MKSISIFFFAFISILSFGQTNFQDITDRNDIVSSVSSFHVSEKITTNYLKKQTRFSFQDNENSMAQNKRSMGIFDIGYQMGIGDYGTDRLIVNLIGGYHIDPLFSVGIGTGLRYYIDSEDAIVPIFAHLRAIFTEQKVSPYISLGIGYSFNFTQSEGLGLLLNPTLGLNLKSSGNAAIHLGLGYEMQKMKVSNYYYGSHVENSGAVSIILGFSF